jgi:hypothetical protein
MPEGLILASLCIDKCRGGEYASRRLGTAFVGGPGGQARSETAGIEPLGWRVKFSPMHEPRVELV